MTVYQNNTIYLNIIFIIFWIILICILSFLGIKFFPLIKTTCKNITESVKRKMKCDISLYFLTIFTVLFYGAIIAVIFVGAENITTNIKSVFLHQTAKTVTYSGEIKNYSYSKIEYRSEVVGYSCEFDIDDLHFSVNEPPYLDSEAIKVLNNGTQVTVIYHEIDNNTVCKIIK